MSHLEIKREQKKDHHQESKAMIVIICSKYTREMKTYGLHLGAGMDGLMVGADGDIGNVGDDGIIDGGCGNGGDDGNIGGGGNSGGSCRYRETSCAKRRQSA